MTQDNPIPLPVLIIGAGLGGLTLAHGLSKHQIPWIIYERDAHLDARLQGYRIRLNLVGLDALRSTLPPDVFSEVVRTGAEFVPGLARVDAVSAELLPLPPPSKDLSNPSRNTPPPPAGIDPDDPLTRLAMSSRLPVDRGVIRNVLLDPLKATIRFNKTFTHYTSSSTSVTAHFSDGTTSVEGSLLVGADGYCSKVTRQLVGGLVDPLDLGPRMFYGKSYLTPSLLSSMHRDLQYGIRIAIDVSCPPCDDGVRSVLTLFVETCRYTHDPDFKDYVFWVLTDTAGFRSFLPDSDILELHGDGAADLALLATRHFHPSVRSIVEHQDRALTSVWAMTCAPPTGIPAWGTDRRVTILGDAIHPMPPTGGLAGNTAMRSAASLVKVLSSSRRGASSNRSSTTYSASGNRFDESAEESPGEGDDDGWRDEVIADYEHLMRSESGRMVTLAHAAATNRYPLGLWKPLHWNGWEVLGEGDGGVGGKTETEGKKWKEREDGKMRQKEFTLTGFWGWGMIG